MSLNDIAPIPPPEAGGSMPLASISPPEFARIEIKGSSNVTAMSVQIGTAECEIYNGADIDVVERTLLTLGKI